MNVIDNIRVPTESTMNWKDTARMQHPMRKLVLI